MNTEQSPAATEFRGLARGQKREQRGERGVGRRRIGKRIGDIDGMATLSLMWIPES
jgi:hypothetical protein